jgi:antitoxin (DNA-binding transcriptional repressor) of toxin-antitoxin stability system
MSKKIYNLYDAKTALSSLVERAAAGTPRAKLVPMRSETRKRRPGGWEGRVRIAKNFDAPLPAALRRAFGDDT